MHEPSALQPLAAPPTLRRSERIAGWVAGLIFLGLGVAVLVAAGKVGTGALVAAAALAGLGVQSLWATARGRRSWLARIGPLP
ncbi:MAG: hypothetical protein JSR41_24295 [Proteobacteria bacterium]|nr:hypothetical protein [Pseudomonadota bacterium]